MVRAANEVTPYYFTPEKPRPKQNGLYKYYMQYCEQVSGGKVDIYSKEN